jgi:hypothetical protein
LAEACPDPCAAPLAVPFPPERIDLEGVDPPPVPEGVDPPPVPILSDLAMSVSSFLFDIHFIVFPWSPPSESSTGSNLFGLLLKSI